MDIVVELKKLKDEAEQLCNQLYRRKVSISSNDSYKKRINVLIHKAEMRFWRRWQKLQFARYDEIVKLKRD